MRGACGGGLSGEGAPPPPPPLGCPPPPRRPPMRRPHLVVLFVVPLAVVAAAGTALGQSSTINWQESFDSKAPQNNPTINTGESVTWNVTEGGHNVDVMGPENFRSTSGEDPKGTQFTHTFKTPGKYTYVCD